MRAVLMVVLGLVASSGIAEQNSIPSMYQLVAEENGIPAKLFYALILNESRSQTTSTEQNKVLPWPWTVNHRGQPHFFASRKYAYVFAKDLVERGDRQFDVGLGQLNWRWQAQRFDDLWEAFDPYANLKAAALHFREQYDRPECNTWELAVGCYHRPGQRPQDIKRAKIYTKRVMSLWVNI